MNALYAIKFFCFVGIFLTHVAYPYDFGSGFTTFFFVFAGFIQFYSFKKNKFELSKESYKKFILNKVIKNYPIYLITLLLSIPYIYPTEHFAFNIKDFLIHLFMLQVWLPTYGGKIYMFNGLSWFLADMMWFYIIIPILYYFVKKFRYDRSNKKIVLLSILAILLNLCIAYFFRNNIETYSKRWWLLYISPFSRFCNCLLGFFMGAYYIKNEKKLIKNVNSFSKVLFTVFELIALSTIILINHKIHLPGSFYICGLGFFPTALTLIFVFSFNKGYISDFLSNKLFVNLGKNCIAYYMLHQTVINYFALFLGAQLWFDYSRTTPFQLTGTLLVLSYIILIGNLSLKYIFNPLTGYLKNKLINE